MRSGCWWRSRWRPPRTPSRCGRSATRAVPTISPSSGFWPNELHPDPRGTWFRGGRAVTAVRTGYAGHRVDLRESRIRKLLRLLEGETPGRLLDVGCAGGELAALLAARGWRVHGAEAEPALVEAARARGIDARAVDLDRAPLPWPAGAFEAVGAPAGVEHRGGTGHPPPPKGRRLPPGGGPLL